MPQRNSHLWNAIPQDSAIKCWARELRDAVTADTGRPADRKRRAMLGNGVMIEHPELTDVSMIVADIAREAGYELFVRCPESGIEPPEGGHFQRPTIVYIKPGLWQCASDSEREGFRQSLRDAIQGSQGGRVIYVTAVVNHEGMDAMLRAARCFDRKFALPCLHPAVQGQLFVDELGKRLVDPSLLAEFPRLGAIAQRQFADRRRRDLLQVALRRRVSQTGKKIRMADILEICARGTTEGAAWSLSDPDRLRQVAIHEAGHALVTYLDSGGATIPPYLTVIGGSDFTGLVLREDAVADVMAGDISVRQAVHEIRTLLGGRAAEFLVYGHHGVGVIGATTDLENATQACLDLFENRGVPLLGETPEQAGANLAIFGHRATAAERERTAEMARAYLQQQFVYVYDLLKQNRVLLERIAAMLCQKKLLLEGDWADILGVGEALAA